MAYYQSIFGAVSFEAPPSRIGLTRCVVSIYCPVRFSRLLGGSCRLDTSLRSLTSSFQVISRVRWSYLGLCPSRYCQPVSPRRCNLRHVTVVHFWLHSCVL